MSTDRFHKAARDGNLDILKEATRRDCNTKDEDGMTPTLWAAFEGNLEALRLIVGRGGDPDKTDHFGYSALHFAAEKGHMSCVTFLANFGANLWALNIDFHTPKELAAMNDREEILRFLDSTTAKEETTNRKHVKAQKEKAQKEAEKRLREYTKVQKKADKYKEKEQKRLEKERERMKENINDEQSQPRASVLSATSPRFSEIVGTVSNAGGKKFGTGIVQRKVQQKLRTGTNRGVPTGGIISDFKVVEVEDGKKSIRSLTGLRRDSEVLYVNSYDKDDSKRGKIADVFDKNDDSQNDYLTGVDSGLDDEILLQEPASIFDRPGFGSVSFRNSMTATLSALPVPIMDDNDLDRSMKADTCSIGSAGSLVKRQNGHRYHEVPWDIQELASDEEEEDFKDEEWSPLQLFLTSNGLKEYIPKFVDEKIDLEALVLLTDEDFKELGLPLGPRRKLTIAIENRKKALDNPGKVEDSVI